MHFEAFISSQRQDLQQHLGFVQKLYIALDEPDGVAGVAASRKQEPTLHEQILDHKSSGWVSFLFVWSSFVSISMLLSPCHCWNLTSLQYHLSFMYLKIFSETKNRQIGYSYLSQVHRSQIVVLFCLFESNKREIRGNDKDKWNFESTLRISHGGT